MPMLRSKLKLEEGWTSFLFLMLMLLSVVWSVQAAEWTDGLGVLQWVALAAMLLGLFLAKQRHVSAVMAHLLSLGIGAVWVTLVLGIVFSPPQIPAALVASSRGLLARVNIMYQHVFSWFRDPSGAEVWLSNFVFIVTLAILTWLLSYVSAWFVYRRHWVWGAVVPAGAACLLNVYYAPPRLVLYLIFYCLSALLLIVRMHVYIRQQIWRKAAVNYNLDVDLTFLRDGMLVSLLAIFLAWTIPVAAASPKLADFWANFQEPWHEVQTRWSRLFTSLRYQGESRLVNFGRTMTLGGAVNLRNTPVLEVQTSEPHYWRAVAYDRYTGSSWINTDKQELVLQANDSRLRPVPYMMQRELTYTVHLLESGEDLLFFAGQPLRVSLPSRARLTGVPISEGQQATDVSMLYAGRTLRRDQSYTVVSLVSVARVSQLRTAGTEYPSWVYERYLQLPDGLPRRVRALSREITDGAATAYDQAVAIQDYLRHITYDQYINAPPAGRDVVDWFLFENRRGYCDYYATAMAVMCRAVGIPARVSQGYTPGEYVPASRSYLVRQLDAHAWPEVYFPGYGWVEFEPTPSEPLIPRPQDEATPHLPGVISGAGGTRIEAEEKFGPDEATVEDENIADIALAQQRPWYIGLLRIALIVLAILAVALLAFLGWWYFSLRELSTAARIYEQMCRLGSMLGVPHLAHQTPAEYGASLARTLPQGQGDVQYIVAMYVKQRFSCDELSAVEEAQLKQRWHKLRSLMWRQMFRLRRRKRGAHAPAWVPSSALRPPTSLR